MPRIKPTSKRILNPHSLQQWLAQLDDHVNSLAWSPDGKWLATASVSGSITIFAGKTGQVLHVLDGHAFGTCEVGWNASGTTLASVGQDGQVRLWNLESGQVRFTLPGGATWVEHLAWSPHSAEGLTEKRNCRKVAKKRGEVRKCHKKWSIKRNDWIIWGS